MVDIELPIREFEDRGTLWLLESPSNLRDFLRLVAADIAEKMDFSRAVRINRSFVPSDLHKQEGRPYLLCSLSQGKEHGLDLRPR